MGAFSVGDTQKAFFLFIVYFFGAVTGRWFWLFGFWFFFLFVVLLSPSVSAPSRLCHESRLSRLRSFLGEKDLFGWAGGDGAAARAGDWATERLGDSATRRG
ncbi:hypothetical protein BZA05DRAFT_165526 [Tricharina praecox]|uniref:uncharacterized protein n=1 Tax=Tricharina praecox TaxID=43433 RepID=UPI00221F529E|nr:uncharacterized protein BZA05DRAFT_165526 [Tricharina praecox]KAI5857075.1 hypothetical protein BZA05DRAFT_165526 [Tricharina praecox]